MNASGKPAQDKRIFDLWLACHTQEEIAEAEDVPQQTVADRISSFTENGNIAKFGKTTQAAADHLTDFDPPIYNVWKQQTKSEGMQGFTL